MGNKLTRIEAIRQRLRNVSVVKQVMDRIGNTPTVTTNYVEDVTELLRLWDTRDAALRALVGQWKQEARDGYASGESASEALSRLLEQAHA